MNQGIKRSIFRWIHLVFAIPILGYVYSPFDQIPNYAPATRYVFVPIMVLSGLWMWKGHVILRLILKDRRKADREIIEEWKWMGSPVWSHDGIIAVANAHKDKVKLTFAHGASLPDPDKLFNAGLKGNAWRAIDFFEGDKINERALRNLVRAAVDYNQIKLKRKAPAGTRAKVHRSLKSNES